MLRAAEWPREDTAEVAAMRRLPRGISLCLAAPEAVAGRGVVDGEIVAPAVVQRFQAPLRPQNMHLINQIPLCAL